MLWEQFGIGTKPNWGQTKLPKEVLGSDDMWLGLGMILLGVEQGEGCSL